MLTKLHHCSVTVRQNRVASLVMKLHTKTAAISRFTEEADQVIFLITLHFLIVHFLYHTMYMCV